MSLSRPVPVQNLDPPSKFEIEDLPKILAALKNAHEAKQSGKVVIDFAENGGVLAITLEMKRKFK